MKKIKLPFIISMFFVACVLTAIYVSLTEQLSLGNVLVGFVISVIALVLTQKLFLHSGYLASLTLSGAYVVYVGYLFFMILKSAVVSLTYIFTKEVSVDLVRYPTTLQSDNLKAMLANAITLSPSTVTADIKDDVIEVMKLCKKDEPDFTAELAKIEKIIKRLDKGNKP